MKHLFEKKKTAVFLSIILAVSIFITCISFFRPVKAEFVIGEFKEQYFVGDELIVPSASATINGEAQAVNYEIITPDGDVYHVPTLILDSYGNYTVRYYVKGTTHSQSVKVKVEQALFSVEGKGSAEYGYHSYLDHVDAETGETIKHGGIITALASGSKFVLNKVVDLSKLSPDEPIITFNITPEAIGYVDFERINIRLIDLHDPSKYVIMRTKDQEWTDGDYLSYSLCSINNDNVYYRKNYEYSAGTLVGEEALLSFRGTPGYDPDNPTAYKEFRDYWNDTLSWYIDYVSQDLFIIGGNKAEKKLVCDLDGTGAWDSFTTGEVRIEIFADTFTNVFANFVIRELAGIDLSNPVLVDTDAPVINVDYGDYDEENLPVGLVGMPYRVFDATANDLVDGACEVKTMVYKNYYSNSRVAISMENGAFKPDTDGVYTICYMSKDSFDNQRTKLVNVNVTKTESKISMSLSGGNRQAKQNETVKIADAVVCGGFGVVKVKTSVYFGNKTIELNDGEFVPMEVGTYNVSFVATDFIGQEVKENYSVTVQHNDTPSVSPESEKLFERYYVKGASYKLPELSMRVFDKSGSGYSEVKSTVSANNGTITNGVFVPQNEGEVTFTYTVEGGTTGGYTITRPVMSVYKADTTEYEMNKLFVLGDGVTADYASNGNAARYVVEKDSSISFVNSLFAESFSLKFYNDTYKSKYSSLDVTLTDSIDANQKVSVRLTKFGSGSYFYLNGRGKGNSIGTSFAGEDFNLSFVASSGVISISGLSVKFNEYLSGEKYEGFSSNKVYLDIAFNGITKDSVDFFVKEVCAQTLIKSLTLDESAPLIIIKGQVEKNGDIGSSFILPEVIAADVICPMLDSFTVTVKKPNGEYATSNGVELRGVPVDRYEIKLDQYGEYIVTYSAIDTNYQEAILGLSVNVFDYVPPTVEISSTKNDKGKIGEIVNIATIVSKSDNYGTISDESGYYVMIKKPTGKIIVLDRDVYNFTPDVAGVYTVYYYVLDTSQDKVSQGNVTILSYTITVS